MKLLIDECIPRKIKKLLPDYETATVQEMGWSSKKDGELLRLATHAFDVFITLDQNMHYQQNIKKAKIAVAVLKSRSNRLVDIEPLIPKLKDVLSDIQAGDIVEIDLPHK